MSNWKKTVNKANQEAYAIPEGWSTEEDVAADIGCPIQRVKEILKPGINVGAIERHTFPLWVEELQSTKRVTCYRPVDARPTTTSTKARGPFCTPVDKRVAAAIKRNPDFTDERIQNNIRGSRIDDVRRLRAELEAAGELSTEGSSAL